MGCLLIDDQVDIDVSDDVLDRVADLLEQPQTEHGGFWLVGQLQVERDGVPSYPNPANRHQRLWISPARLVTLTYDRPLSPDPDRPFSAPRTVVI